jgi:transglutaminase-like putative cysteine protease
MGTAGTLRLEVRHETRYEYESLVSAAHHLAHLRPLADEHQLLEDFTLEIDPAPPAPRSSTDVYGNARLHFSLTQAHQELSVRATSVVEVRPRFAALGAAGGPRCGELAASLRYVARAPYQSAVEFTFPSPYVPALPELAAYAAASLSPKRPVAEASLELMHRLHSDFTYESRSTAVDTPLARAFDQRRGVCQDFAHLLIGALRSAGLPARYVSGYLLTQAAGGAPVMLGADASHAWAQVWCPGTPGVPQSGAHAGWLSLDPTNDVVPGAGHVRLAVGRDYGDVTPLRGVIRGGGRHRLTVAVATRTLPPRAQTVQARSLLNG